MNIFKISLVGLALAAIGVGCGGGDDHPNAAKLAACAKGMSQSANPTCDKCIQEKCAASQKKCSGEDFNGGPCQSYWACQLALPDPCAIMSQCTRSAECQMCLSGDNCVAACTSVCTSNIGGGSGGSGPGPGGRNGGGFGNGPGGFGNDPGIGGFGNDPGIGGFGNDPGIGGFGNGPSTGGGCAELNACCSRITEPNLKSACAQSYSTARGNEPLCAMILDALIDFC